jgi:hypothetical protein
VPRPGGLAQDLLEATVADVEQNVGRPADILP